MPRGIADFPVLLTNLSAVELSTETRRVMIQIALEGHWPHVKYGTVEITKDMLRNVHRNFSQGIYPPPPIQPPIDYEHLSTQLNRKPGDGRAAGWIAALELRNGDSELWADVEWNDAAAESIRKKEYRYFSPTLHPDFPGKDGKGCGVTLLGGAITNYPTMPLEAIACDNSPTMAVAAFPTTIEPKDPYMKIIKVKNAQGVEVEIDLASLSVVPLTELAAIPSIAELQAKVPGAGAIVVAQTDFATMQTQLQTLSGTVDTQQSKIETLTNENKTFKEKAIADEIGALMAQGKILPNEKDQFIALSQANRAMFDTWMKSRREGPALINLGQIIGSGQGGVGGTNSVDAFEAKVQEIRTANPKLSYSDAVKKASTEHVELAQLAKDEETIRL